MKRTIVVVLLALALVAVLAPGLAADDINRTYWPTRACPPGQDVHYVAKATGSIYATGYIAAWFNGYRWPGDLKQLGTSGWKLTSHQYTWYFDTGMYRTTSAGGKGMVPYWLNYQYSYCGW